MEGFRIDRLVNRAIEEKIYMRQMRIITETEMECYIALEELQRLKKVAKSLYKITVLKHVGREYAVKTVIKKPFRIVLVVIAVILIISQSLFVKTIEIRGYKGIPEEEIRKCLEDAGISEGSYIPDINWDEAEELIYDVFPQISWIQLVYDGRKVFLNISEGAIVEDGKQQQEAKKYYCNIIATKSGYIDSINNYRGVALVEEGDYVEEGQILILGCVPIKEKYHRENAPTEYYVKSAGEILALVPYRLTFQQRFYNSKGEVKNKKEITEKVEQQLRQWAQENLPEKAEILNKDLNFSYKENIIEVGVTIEIRQQIGEEQEILIGQKNSDSSGN